MKNTYTVNGEQVEFTQINIIYDGIEVNGLLLHDKDGEYITSDIDFLPGDDEEAQTIIENCWWVTHWYTDNNGYYISEE